MKKILLLCASSQSVINFRCSLIERLRDQGYRVSITAFDCDYEKEIRALGVDFYHIDDENRSTNPFHIVSLPKKYEKIIRIVNPDIVFTFMLKPNIFGVKAAHKSGVRKIYAMVEGAGDVFHYTSLKWKLLRQVICLFYKSSLRFCQKVFFLNRDDAEEFSSRGLVRKEQCEVIKGIGVDLEKFSYQPIQKKASFLMIARMLENKGVLEYCRAAREVKKAYPEADFYYLGAEGNVKIADIQTYLDDGSIRYGGTVKDVRPYLKACSVFVLPSSYREGLPMSIMEAEATGRAILTSDNFGCRDTLVNGYNGFLVQRHDVEDLQQKMRWFIEHPEEEERMGQNSRQFAEEHFDQKVINRRILDLIGETHEKTECAFASV